MEQAIQAERVNGFRDYIDDVKSGTFPGPQHIVNAPEGLINQFLSAVDGSGGESLQNDAKHQNSKS
jgi:3-methyl-2-oxobutanoate hydroxymethyltransferase